MAHYFVTKIRYSKLQPVTFKHVTVTETYIVSADSVAESESSIIVERMDLVNGAVITVPSVKKADITEVFRDDTLEEYTYYKCKLSLINYDEKSGKERGTSKYILVQATDFDTACKNLKKGLRGTVSDYTIESVVATQILEVYEFIR